MLLTGPLGSFQIHINESTSHFNSLPVCAFHLDLAGENFEFFLSPFLLVLVKAITYVLVSLAVSSTVLFESEIGPLDAREASERVADIKDIHSAVTMLVCIIEVNVLDPIHIGERKVCPKLSARSYNVLMELTDLKGVHVEVDVH